MLTPIKRPTFPKPEPESRLTDAFQLLSIYRATAILYGRGRAADPASALAARGLELWRHWERTLPGNVFVRRQLESRILPSHLALYK